MRLRRRAAGPDPGAVLDVGLAIAGAGLTALAAWRLRSQGGTGIAGPPWLLAVLPLLIGAPLAVRRRVPLLMWTLLWAGISLQVLITRTAPEGADAIRVDGG